MNTEYLLTRALDQASTCDFEVVESNGVFRVKDLYDEEIFLTESEAKSAILKLVLVDKFDDAWCALSSVSFGDEYDLEKKWSIGCDE